VRASAEGILPIATGNFPRNFHEAKYLTRFTRDSTTGRGRSGIDCFGAWQAAADKHTIWCNSGVSASRFRRAWTPRCLLSRWPPVVFRI